MSIEPVSKPSSPRFSVVKEIFNLDLRSLALFRVALSSLIIIDLIQRCFDLKAHYTDLGVLPRWALTQGVGNRWHLSLHNITGMFEIEAIIFLIHGLVAFMLLLGFKTRWATIICWILIVSLHSRNPIILSGGDILLCVMLFWSIFLPLGSRFSIDHALDSGNGIYKKVNAYFSVATMAVLIQIAVVYWFNWLAKLHPTWIEDYTAVYYAMSLDMYATKLGTALLGFPLLMQAATWSTLWLELLGPLLLFSPIKNGTFRIAVLIGFILLHLGIALTLNIGYFPAVSIIVWMLVIPGLFWDRIANLCFRGSSTYFSIYYDNDCDFCKKTVDILRVFLILKNASISPAQGNPTIEPIFRKNNSWVIVTSDGSTLIRFNAFVYALKQVPVIGYVGFLLEPVPLLRLGNIMYTFVANNRRFLSRVTVHLKYKDNSFNLPIWAQVLAVISILYVVMWNIAVTEQLDFKIPRALYWAGPMLRIYQEWHMFAPYPALGDGWYVIPGELRNGSTVDVYTRKPITWEKPKDVSETYENNRWRKYLLTLYKAKYKDERLYYGKYICRSWNAPDVETEHDLTTFEIYFVEERTHPPGEAPTIERRRLWGHSCYK
ncbi:MAG: DCC1-like thiol-disulfide oxidoreductase family protein [Chloroflexota bacterium]|nr:DCC1-like thiol-disulfide oxidoreductase family protein [Chloroflexota bacterium]